MTPADHDRALLDALRGLAGAGLDDTTFATAVRALLLPAVSKASAPVVVRALVPLKVRFPDGSATNISLPQSLLEEAALHFGASSTRARRRATWRCRRRRR